MENIRAFALVTTEMRLVRFRLEVGNAEVLRDAFMFLGEKARDTKLAAAVFDELYKRIQEDVLATGTCVALFYLSTNKSRWLSPNCRTQHNFAELPLGGVRWAGPPLPSLTDGWNVFSLTPEMRLVCLLVGLAQRMSLTDRFIKLSFPNQPQGIKFAKYLNDSSARLREAFDGK
jgi:hypothetical protein